MPDPQIQKLADFIEILEKLSESIEQHAGQDAIEELSKEADLTLCGLEACISRNSRPSDGMGGHYYPPSGNFGHDLLRDIRHVIKTCRDDEHRYMTGSDDISRLIDHLKKVQYRLKNETESPHRKPEGLNRNDKSSEKDEQREGESKEKPWDDNNTEYIANSEAIVTFTNSKMSLSALSKLLKPGGSIRYMRYGQRTRVHIGDFRDYASKRYVPDKLANDIADERLADREAMKEEMKRRKNRTGK